MVPRCLVGLFDFQLRAAVSEKLLPRRTRFRSQKDKRSIKIEERGLTSHISESPIHLGECTPVCELVRPPARPPERNGAAAPATTPTDRPTEGRLTTVWVRTRGAELKREKIREEICD